ncbi:MAG: hypothetical protein JSV62_06410 [Promethearchaeota archaeon]|nr:MAG: hypothetical protein JSV62_06410 [Candidatus Lokiarchaeota archaeon]
MPLRFNFCPFCNEKIIFEIDMKDINSSHYPAPVYIQCKLCKKTSTFYVDSLLRVSYIELDKKPGGIKTIKTK